MASGGHIPQEILEQEVNRIRPDAQGKVQVLLAKGAQQMGAAQYEEAVQTFEEAVEISDQLGLASALYGPEPALAGHGAPLHGGNRHEQDSRKTQRIAPPVPKKSPPARFSSPGVYKMN